MSDDLGTATVETAGQPATVRVGTVMAINPLSISMGGTLLQPDAVGVLADYAPVVGDTVPLLGQSVDGAQSSGSTWLALGAVTPGHSARSEVSMLAVKQDPSGFDSATYTVAAGEQLVGGNWNLTVPLKAGHLVGIHMTFQHSNTSGVAALTTVRFRENSLAGTPIGGKNFVPGAGNAYIGGRLDAWIRPSADSTLLIVATTQAVIVGTGQFGVAAADTFMACDYGLASNVTLL